MPKKVVAHHRVVNFVVAALLGLTACSTSSQGAGDEYLAQAQEAQQEDQIAEARVYAELALEEGRREAEARRMLAELARARGEDRTERGDHQGALEAYLKAADYETSPERRGQDLVDALQAAQQAQLPMEERLQLVHRALEDRPHDHELRRKIAHVAEDRGDDATAAEQYLWLFSADPEDIQSGLRLGIIYMALDRPGDAASILQQVYDRQPDNVQAAINLANAYATLRYDEEAAQLFESLLEQFPEHPAVLRHYADFEERRGHHARARQLRQQAQQASPGVEQREMRPLR